MTDEPPTPDPDNPALRTSRTSRHTQRMPAHPDAVIADSCLRLANRFEEEAVIVAIVDDDLAGELMVCADAYRAAAARHRRRRRGLDETRPSRPRLHVVAAAPPRAS